MNDLQKLGNLESLDELSWELLWSFVRDDYWWFFAGLLVLLGVLFVVNYFKRLPIPLIEIGRTEPSTLMSAISRTLFGRSKAFDQYSMKKTVPGANVQAAKTITSDAISQSGQS